MRGIRSAVLAASALLWACALYSLLSVGMKSAPRWLYDVVMIGVPVIVGARVWLYLLRREEPRA